MPRALYVFAALLHSGAFRACIRHKYLLPLHEPLMVDAYDNKVVFGITRIITAQQRINAYMNIYALMFIAPYERLRIPQARVKPQAESCAVQCGNIPALIHYNNGAGQSQCTPFNILQQFCIFGISKSKCCL